MHEALEMPQKRRQALHQNAYNYVTTSTASTWADKFVSALTRLHFTNGGLLPDATANIDGLLSLLATHRRLPGLAFRTALPLLRRVKGLRDRVWLVMSEARAGPSGREARGAQNQRALVAATA